MVWGRLKIIFLFFNHEVLITFSVSLDNWMGKKNLNGVGKLCHLRSMFCVLISEERENQHTEYDVDIDRINGLIRTGWTIWQLGRYG